MPSEGACPYMYDNVCDFMMEGKACPCQGTHSSDCNVWVGEPCGCVTARDARQASGQLELPLEWSEERPL